MAPEASLTLGYHILRAEERAPNQPSNFRARCRPWQAPDACVSREALLLPRSHSQAARATREGAEGGMRRGGRGAQRGPSSRARVAWTGRDGAGMRVSARGGACLRRVQGGVSPWPIWDDVAAVWLERPLPALDFLFISRSKPTSPPCALAFACSDVALPPQDDHKVQFPLPEPPWKAL